MAEQRSKPTVLVFDQGDVSGVLEDHNVLVLPILSDFSFAVFFKESRVEIDLIVIPDILPHLANMPKSVLRAEIDDQALALTREVMKMFPGVGVCVLINDDGAIQKFLDLGIKEENIFDWVRCHEAGSSSTNMIAELAQKIFNRKKELGANNNPCRQEAIQSLNDLHESAFAEGEAKTSAKIKLEFNAQGLGLRCKILADKLSKEAAISEKTLDEVISVAMTMYYAARLVHDALFEMVAAEICSSEDFKKTAEATLPREGDRIGHGNRDLFIRQALERAEEMRKGIMKQQPDSNAFKFMMQQRAPSGANGGVQKANGAKNPAG